MPDEIVLSLHEELVSSFMHSVRTEAEVAAANEIERLRKENEALRKQVAGKPAVKSSKKGEGD